MQAKSSCKLQAIDSKYDYRKIPSFECNFRYVQAFLDAYRRLKQTLSQQRAPELSMEYDVHVKKPPL